MSLRLKRLTWWCFRQVSVRKYRNNASSGRFRGISSTFGARLAFRGIGNNYLGSLRDTL